MNRIRQNSINYLLFLNLAFVSFFGEHYPREIVGIIILIYWKLHPIKISAKGCKSSISFDGSTYVMNNKQDKLLKKLDLDKIETIAFGEGHILALKCNKIYASGRNDDGQLGLGNCQNQKDFCKIDLDLVVEICCGWYHSMAICSDDKVYSWGHNRHGQLGLGHKDFYCLPRKLNLKAIKICAWEFFSMALTINGEVYVWGDNKLYQLGLGHTNTQCYPQKLNLIGIKEIYCSRSVSFAFGFNGKIYGWGYNNGQLATTYIFEHTPQELDLTHIVTISCGDGHLLAVNINNELICIGKNNYGQLGLNKTSEYEFHTINPYLTHIIQVACGSYHSMAMTALGDVYVWGKNDDGRLGLDDCLDQHIPKKIEF